jgi:hypothetical protein
MLSLELLVLYGVLDHENGPDYILALRLVRISHTRLWQTNYWGDASEDLHGGALISR